MTVSKFVLFMGLNAIQRDNFLVCYFHRGIVSINSAYQPVGKRQNEEDVHFLVDFKLNQNCLPNTEVNLPRSVT